MIFTRSLRSIAMRLNQFWGNKSISWWQRPAGICVFAGCVRSEIRCSWSERGGQEYADAVNPTPWPPGPRISQCGVRGSDGGVFVPLQHIFYLSRYIYTGSSSYIYIYIYIYIYVCVEFVYKNTNLSSCFRRRDVYKVFKGPPWVASLRTGPNLNRT